MNAIVAAVLSLVLLIAKAWITGKIDEAEKVARLKALQDSIDAKFNASEIAMREKNRADQGKVQNLQDQMDNDHPK